MQKRPLKKVLDQPPAVIQKWMNIKAIKKAEQLARWYIRIKLSIMERKGKEQLKKTFDEIKKQSIRLENSNYEAAKYFTNMALYFLLAECDIQAVKVDALTHPDPWKRNLALRTILLILHEWDMSKVAGRDLKKMMQVAGISNALQQEVILALREVRKAQARAQKILSHVRNSAIAHRDPNALLQYRAIRDLDAKLVLNLAAEFYSGADSFIRILPRLIEEGGEMKSLLRQLIQAGRDS